MPTSPVAISVTVNPRDIARIEKRLDKWQGKPLETRIEKAVQGGLKLLIAPIRLRAARHHRTGATERGVAVKKLRKRPGEAVAYKVGVSTPRYARAVIGGPYSAAADPYVTDVYRALEGQVDSFIDQQVRRLG